MFTALFHWYVSLYRSLELSVIIMCLQAQATTPMHTSRLREKVSLSPSSSSCKFLYTLLVGFNSCFRSLLRSQGPTLLLFFLTLLYWHQIFKKLFLCCLSFHYLPRSLFFYFFFLFILAFRWVWTLFLVLLLFCSCFHFFLLSSSSSLISRSLCNLPLSCSLASKLFLLFYFSIFSPYSFLSFLPCR